MDEGVDVTSKEKRERRENLKEEGEGKERHQRGEGKGDR